MGKKWKRCKEVVKQLRNDEWDFEWNSISRKFLTAERNDIKLWVGNTCFNCDLYGEDVYNYFGYFGRLYVYWFGVYGVKRRAMIKRKALIEGRLDRKILSESEE